MRKYCCSAELVDVLQDGVLEDSVQQDSVLQDGVL